MKFIFYLRVELRRAFLSRNTWLAAVLTLLAPLVGYGLYQPATQSVLTSSGEFIGNPTLAGAIGGVILFALLTLFELDRVHKSGTDKLTDTIVSPLTLYLTRVLSLLAAATATGVAVTLLYLPYTIYKVGYLFELSTYLGCWFLIFLPALWMGCLLAAVLYQLTRRVDFSLVLLIALAVPCFTSGLQGDFILCWINPDVPFLSDMFGNTTVLRWVAYNRLFWLVALSGLYIITLLCVRRYGKSAWGSFLFNSRRFYKPLMGTACIVLSVNLYFTQSLVSRADPTSVIDFYSSEHKSDIELIALGCHTLLEPDLQKGTIKGTSTWTFGRVAQVTIPHRNEDNPFKMSLAINSGLEIYSVTVNGKLVTFNDPHDDKLLGVKFVTFEMPYSPEIELAVKYGGYSSIWRDYESNQIFSPVVSPQYLAFSDYNGPIPPNLWFWNGNTHGYSPTLGLFRSVVDVVLPANLMLINRYSFANFQVEEYSYWRVSKPQVVSENEDGSRTWSFYSLLNRITASFYAADYLYQRVGSGDNVIEFYYPRKSQQTVEKYDVFALLEDVYNYCAVKITPQPPRDVIVIQTPGQSEAEFSETALSGQWKAATGGNTYAYQIMAQWWNGIRFVSRRNIDGEEIAQMFLQELTGSFYLQHEWSAYGLVEYIAYRFAKGRFGEEYAIENYVNVWKSEVNSYYSNFYVRNPEYKEVLSQSYIARLGRKEQNALYYYSMPLKIYKAAQLIGGEEKMDEIIAQLYTFAYNNKESEQRPKSDNTVDDFWEKQGMEHRPQGKTDEYFTQLYKMLFGQATAPGTLTHFLLTIPSLEAIFAECELSGSEPIAKLMSKLYNQLLESYNEGQPTLTYTDFLATCGLTEEDLELTEADYSY